MPSIHELRSAAFAERFDAALRTMSATTSRRGALAALIGATLVGQELDSASAACRGKKGKKKRKCRRRHQQPQSPPPPASNPTCNVDSDCPSDNDGCCNGLCIDIKSDRNHCGSCFAVCGTDQVCHSGTCQTCDVCDDCRYTTVAEALSRAATGATIAVCPGTYQERIRITRSVTIEGIGASQSSVTLDGDGRSARAAVVTVEADPAADVVLRNMTITGGNTNKDGVGAGITNSGTLMLERVTVTINDANSFNGGGIANNGVDARLTLKSCRVSYNAADNGGGISNDRGTVNITDNTRIEQNEAIAEGGGIRTVQGSVTMDTSFVTDNKAARGAGLRNNQGNVALKNLSGVSDNRAELTGGGIDNRSGTVSLEGDAFVLNNRSDGGAGSGGGIFNEGTVTTGARFSISGNTPDNCVNSGGGTGCPA